MFENPEAVKPERMMGESYRKMSSSKKKGFVNGKCGCIGKVCAWQWSFVTLVSILKRVALAMAGASYELKMNNGARNMKPVEFFAKTGVG